MCGIVGIIGKGNLEDKLITTLKNLEYRGYDSAGIAVLKHGKICITKSEGKIENLEKIVKNTSACCGIAHTRWATTGKASVENAHPHLSENGEFAVVHNGIIENYEKLKKELIKNKVKFTSETDTEVIVQLLEQCKEKNTLERLIKVCKRLEGSFALCILKTSLPFSRNKKI